MRNIQLGSFSLLLGLLAVVFKDGAAVAERGFFAGYGPMVWLCVSLNSLGGLAVAMVVKYADNVVRFFTLLCIMAVVCPGSKLFISMGLCYRSQDQHSSAHPRCLFTTWAPCIRFAPRRSSALLPASPSSFPASYQLPSLA